MPKNASVRFSEHDYLAGKFSVMDELRKIPGRDYRAKQRAIAAGAFKLQYAIDDLPRVRGVVSSTARRWAPGFAAFSSMRVVQCRAVSPRRGDAVETMMNGALGLAATLGEYYDAPLTPPAATPKPTKKPTWRPVAPPESAAEPAVADAGRATAPGSPSNFFNGLGLGLLAAAFAAAVVLVRRRRGRG